MNHNLLVGQSGGPTAVINGREDQSVNEKVMISRVDQQIFVTKSMIDMYDMRKISNKKLRAYMTNYLAIMMTVSSLPM